MKRHAIKAPLQSTSMPNALKRPNHKAAIHEAERSAEINKKKPEPMTLIHKREKAVLEGQFTDAKNAATLGAIEKAAIAMADWDLSDPFAYDRTALYVKQGYLISADVVEEMGKRTIARRAARIREVENAKAKS